MAYLARNTVNGMLILEGNKLYFAIPFLLLILVNSLAISVRIIEHNQHKRLVQLNCQ
jgi:hypothetical protein